MAAEKTIFTFLNNLYFKQDLKYDKKIAPAYLLSLWLSHDKSLIEMVNEINEYQFLLADDLIYAYYYNKVPKGKRYIKWVKKAEEDKKSKDAFDFLRKELMLSKKEAAHFKAFTNILKTDKIDKKVNATNASSIFLKGDKK